MSEKLGKLVSGFRLALSAPFILTGATLTVSGYTITLIAEWVAGTEL